MADLPDDEVFKIVAYMVSSAALVPEETFALASFRLLDAAHRLIEACQPESNGQTDVILTEIVEQFQAHFNEVMLDEERFFTWTRQLCAQVAREARLRNLQAGVSASALEQARPS